MMGGQQLWLLSALLVSMPLHLMGQDLASQTCTQNNSAIIQDGATVWLGGILSFNSVGSDGYGCGQGTFSQQSYEALRWVLELLNKKDENLQGDFLTDYYVPGIRLGMVVHNYCNDERAALAALSEVYPQALGDPDSCFRSNDTMMAGIIGPSRSDDAMMLLEEAQDYEIPVISFEATAPALTMSGMYGNFMRTISPDGPLMDVIVEVLLELKWQFVAVIYDDSFYGRAAFSELHSRLVAKGICLTVGVMVDAAVLENAENALNQVINTEVVGVIYFGPESFARALMAKGEENLAAASRLQWVLADFPVNSFFTTSTVYHRGIISITAASRFIVEFEDHWLRLEEATHSNAPTENPWFTRWYEDRNDCSFSPQGQRDCNTLFGNKTPGEIQLEKRVAYEQDQYVEAAVMSVFTFARALREAQIAKCGAGISGPCQAFKDMTREEFLEDYLKKVDFLFSKTERVPSLASDNVPPYNAIKHLRFKDNGDIDDPSYYIWNFNNIELGAGDDNFKFRRVGSYISGRLDLNNVGFYGSTRQNLIDHLPDSPCPLTGCAPCLGLPADLKYYYEPGDAVINGIFSMHGMGMTPLSCGGMLTPNSPEFLEAMIYAVNKVNSDNSVLTNIKLGGLGMDDCRSSTLGQAYLVQVQRGTMPIANAHGGDVLDPRSIEAYTAALGTPETLPLAEAMNHLLRPMVGYRAGGTQLMDENMYPYYLLARPDVKDEMMAIVLLLKERNWHYVQVISSYAYYSMDAEKEFRRLAAEHGICIVAVHTLGNSPNSSMGVVSGLEEHENVQPVISLLEGRDSRRLLMALAPYPVTRSKFVLIGTTHWGTIDLVVKGLESVADGALTLSVRHSTMNQFKDHLRNLDPQTYTANPWFLEWYHAVHNCTPSTCDYSKDITEGDDTRFILNYEVEPVINAVYAIARGMDALLKKYCGLGYTNICKAFSDAHKGMEFVEAIQKATFQIEDLVPTAIFSFHGRTGMIPFELYNYKNGKYVKVRDIDPWQGTIEGTAAISLYGDIEIDHARASCPVPCLECLYMFQYIKYWYIPGDLLIGGIFDVHYAGEGPFDCGAIRAKNGAMYTELFSFALNRINNGTATVTLDNFHLGGIGFDGCTNPPRANAIINRVHTGMSNIRLMGEPFSPKKLVSWMSYDSATTIEIAQLLQALNMPLVSPGATSWVLNDKEMFHTFFRTIPSDSVVVRGMAEFVKEMGWPYVVVLNSPDHANRHSRDLFREYLKAFGICVIADYEFETDGSFGIILDSIVEMGTQVVAVFSEPDKYVEEFLAFNAQDSLDKRIDKGIKYISNRPWGRFTEQYTGGAQAKRDLLNSVFFQFPSPNIADFTQYLNQGGSMTSPWFNEIYEEVMDCNLPGSFHHSQPCDTNNPVTSGRDWEQDIWTLSTLNAIYSVAEAVNMHKVSRCGRNNIGICEAFYQQDPWTAIQHNLDVLNFTDITSLYFEYIKREANRGYRLMRYEENSAPVEEGHLNLEGALSLDSREDLMRKYTDVRSQCSGDCLVCTTSDADVQDFSLVNGDIFIVGLFDIHKQGGSPFTCGAINDKHGLPLLEAFNYAIEYVNNKTGIFVDKLPGIRIGGVGLDMCQSPSRAANLVANLHNGNIQLVKGGITINPKRIDAYIGTMDTESSIRVADILTQLSMPQISYGATGMELLDRDKYNFFLRSVPADDKQARAIVSYLKKFKYNNIQVVYSFDEIGEPGLDEFDKVTQANTICVTKKFLVGEQGVVTATEAEDMVTGFLQQGGPQADVVVLWMKNPLPILEAASANIDVSKNFLFIVTDKWGADPDFLKNTKLTNLLRNRNLVTLDVETADIPGFDHYLEYKTPDNYIFNPWFKEYFEDLQDCYWDESTGTRTKPCDKSSTIPRADAYIQDPYVLYVVNAVFSAAMGIDKALRALCNTPYYGVCNLYRTSGERRQNVMQGLLKVNFIDDTFQPYFYTPDGQSDRGFHIYNVTSEGTDTNFVYTNVGSYNDTHFLKLDITYDSVFDAVCDPTGSDPGLEDCVCPFPEKRPSRYMKKDEEDRGLTLVYVGDIHQESPGSTLACGPINTGPDLQKLLAFFYAIDLVNSNTDSTFQDSIKLNGLALDSCTHGLRLGQDVYNVLSGNQLCDTDLDSELISPSSIVSFIIDNDKNSLPVGQMLSDYRITSISPTSSHDMLSDRFLYPYFLRTKGDNVDLAEVILQIAKQAGWNYLSVIFSKNLSKDSAKKVLLERSQQASVCFGEAEPLGMGAGLPEAELVLEKISQQVGARGVVLFVEPAHLTLLLQASRNLGLTGRFVWIIPSDWAHVGDNIRGLEQEIAGSIRIETRSAILADFNRYVKSLTFNNRLGIPDDWFLEIYESMHQCNVLRDDVNQRRYSRICTQEERITDEMISQDPAVLHVIISVLSSALGLQEIQECKSADLDIAACLQTYEDQRNDLIYDGISDISFQVLPSLLGDDSFTFSFDTQGDGQAGYIINNYRATGPDDRTTPDEVLPSYAAFEIGEFSDSTLTLDLSNFAGGNLLSQGSVPESKCPIDDTCTCKTADGRTWDLEPPSNPEVIVGQVYEGPLSAEPVFVKGIPGTNDRFEDTWAIIVTVIAAVGAFVSLVVFVYLLVMYPVRGGTSILGYILSFGIVLLYLMVFPFIAHADTQMCGLRRFGLGFVYAIVYSALLVKLIDCWRVRGKQEAYDVKYSKLGRPTGLFMITIFFILVQVMIEAEWLILEEPSMVRVFYKGYYWPRCTDNDDYDESLVLSLCYVMALIVFSLFLGLVTYTSTKNHKESRWILAILVLSVPCWVIWCLVAILGTYKVRDAAVAIGLLVNATVMLLLVPLRKLYLLHKYNVLIEEEEEQLEEARSQLAASQRGNEYNSVYGRQYDNPKLQDSGSNLGSGY